MTDATSSALTYDPATELPPLRNGTRRGKDGLFRSGGTATQITPANARAMLRRRWELQRAAFADGIADAIRATGLLPPADEYGAAAWRVIAQRAAELLLDTTDAAKFARLLRACADLAGYAPPAEERDDDGTVRLTVTYRPRQQAAADAPDVVDVSARDAAQADTSPAAQRGE